MSSFISKTTNNNETTVESVRKELIVAQACNRKQPRSAAVNSLLLIDTLKVNLASQLLLLSKQDNRNKQQQEEALLLVREVVECAYRDEAIGCSAPIAFACELLIDICLSRNKEEQYVASELRSCAKLASMSGFNTPLALFVVFIEFLWLRSFSHLIKHQSMNGLRFEHYFNAGIAICSNNNDNEQNRSTVTEYMPLLERSAFSGLLEAQQLLVIVLTNAAMPLSIRNEKLAAFIAFGWSRESIQQMLGCKVRPSFDLIST
jgi:hypothetical protein